MKGDVYAELYLWNKNFDALLRILQRIEMLGICPSELLKGHQAQLEELRAASKLDVLRVIFAQERIDHQRMNWLREIKKRAGSNESTHH